MKRVWMKINYMQPSPAKRTAPWHSLQEIYAFLQTFLHLPSPWCGAGSCFGSHSCQARVPQGWQEDGGETCNPMAATAPLPSTAGKGKVNVIVAQASLCCTSDLTPHYMTLANYPPFRYCKYWHNISLADVTWCTTMYISCHIEPR